MLTCLQYENYRINSKHKGPTAGLVCLSVGQRIWWPPRDTFVSSHRKSGPNVHPVDVCTSILALEPRKTGVLSLPGWFFPPTAHLQGTKRMCPLLLWPWQFAQLLRNLIFPSLKCSWCSVLIVWKKGFDSAEAPCRPVQKRSYPSSSLETPQGKRQFCL
jgi:hypothetical protein